MEKLKSVLSGLTLLWLWLSAIILAIYVVSKAPWFLAIPFGLTLVCAITYAAIIIYEKVK